MKNNDIEFYTVFFYKTKVLVHLFECFNLDNFFIDLENVLPNYLLTLTDRAPIRTLIDWGGGGLLSPPPSISETIIDRDPTFFLVVHVYL